MNAHRERSNNTQHTLTPSHPHQVCDLGSELGLPYLLIQNFLGPLLPAVGGAGGGVSVTQWAEFQSNRGCGLEREWAEFQSVRMLGLAL